MREGLSEPERRLWMEFPYGTHIDLRSGDAERDNPRHAVSWGTDRLVSAQVIMDLLVGRRPVDEQQEMEQGEGESPSVFLSGARITGRLDLSGIDFAPPLLLQGCALDEPLVIADSMCRSVRLYGCHLPGVKGAWLISAGDLHLRGCHINGAVDLTGAYVGGQLVLSTSELSNPGGVALRADGLVVAGDMFCRDKAVVEGEASLVAARVAGELRFTGSTLRNPGGVALRADRITVEKDMYCREGFAAEGEVRLYGGHVKGQLNFNNATLRNPGQVALNADQLVVGSHLYCHDHFVAQGEVRMVAARVGGEVRFSTSTLSNPNGVALRADRLAVAADMYCREKLTVLGEISLRGAQVEGQLNFNNATLHNKGGTALRADRLVVGTHLYCHDNFAAEGEISLVAARVGGEVRFSASTLSNPGHVALRADRLYVADDMYCREKLTVDGTVSLRGAHISGQLNFNHATLRHPGQVALDADQLVVGEHLYCQEGLEVEGGISLVAARVGGEVRFSASTLSNPDGVALRADRLVVGNDMYCREKLVIDGEVSLRGAHVKGDLSFSTTTVRNPGGVALRADQLTVDSDLYCNEGFTAEGLVDLTDAHISGEVSLNKAMLHNAGGVALLAPRLIVENDMFCRDGFTVNGTVCLIGAHIAGKLSLTGAHLTGARLTDQQLDETRIAQLLHGGAQPVEPQPADRRRPSRWHSLLPGALRPGARTAQSQPRAVEQLVSGADGLALVADGLRVDIDMTCDASFTARGEIRLKRARIGQNLDFSNADIENPGGGALDAEELQANRMLMPAKCGLGRISLRNAKMTELDDKRGVQPDQIDISGLSYETLIPPLDAETRLEWLSRVDRFETQPYEQLARSYRRLGYDDKARKVELAKERRLRETPYPPVLRAWGRLQDWTIGYGYLPDRAAALFGALLVFGIAVFTTFPPPPLDTSAHPHFNPFFYTLDLLIPFADFGQRSLWNPGVGLQWFEVVFAIVGWTLAGAAIAGITRALSRS